MNSWKEKGFSAFWKHLLRWHFPSIQDNRTHQEVPYFQKVAHKLWLSFSNHGDCINRTIFGADGTTITFCIWSQLRICLLIKIHIYFISRQTAQRTDRNTIFAGHADFVTEYRFLFWFFLHNKLTIRNCRFLLINCSVQALPPFCFLVDRFFHPNPNFCNKGESSLLSSM